MYLHHIRVYRITLILAIVAITCRISWASTQCKTAVMDVHMKRCRLGAGRIKRGLERFDLKHDDTLKYDKKSKKQEGPDSSEVNDWPSRGTPQKRQILGDVASDFVQPMMRVMGSATQPKVPFGTGLYDSFDPSDLGPLSTWSSLPPVLYFLGQGLRTLHLDNNNDLGFDLDDEELDELYNDIYKRQPRGSKEEAWKAFVETASKCCQNVDRCLKETTFIPCLI
ncbi:uncharacterized protein [Linepithema humile]|uniref:uncharacterized protein isoform X2 n=1 Tax=Linepithema humile TaxID=83485 RepID=UPI000623273F|nr:PREDICTED: uncharacterized protein LOC105675057 isoform X2 [Linepithema humile]